MIEYTLKPSRRAIRITASIRHGKVRITAPDYYPEHRIDSFVEESEKQLQEIIDRQLRYKVVHGQYLNLLDQCFQVIFEPSLHQNFRFEGNLLYLKPCNKALYEAAANRLRPWIEQLLPKACQVMGLSVPEFQIKMIDSYWGKNFIGQRKIVFSSHLAFFPPECLEAVIFHELTHFFHADHSKRFYHLLNSCYPQYERVHAKLDADKIFFIEQE